MLKQVDDQAEAAWIADLVAGIEQRGFRLSQPLRAPDGRWVVDGWTAWTHVEGEHSTTRWADLLDAADAFHHAVREVPCPEFITRLSGANRWRMADQIAWGERSANELSSVRHLLDLLAARRPIDLPAQLIHGDLVGNVLFADRQPPAIIDLSLYWRPVGYSAALVVGDALTWEGSSPDVLRLIQRVDQWPQLLLRALIFRIVVNALAERVEPWRLDVSEEYRSTIDLVLELTKA